MKNLEYQFDIVPPEGKLGFESFMDEETEDFFFTYNDSLGHPILFSRTYTSHISRDKALKLAKQHISNPIRYKNIDDDNEFHFVLRSGNHQELCRSKPFLDIEDRNQGKEALFESLGLNEPSDMKSSASKKEKKKGLPSPEPAKTVTEIQSKSKFQVEFYQAGQSEPLAGKVEHLINNGDKAHFEGIDMDFLESFFKARLPFQKSRHKKDLLSSIPSDQIKIVNDNAIFGDLIQKKTNCSVEFFLKKVPKDAKLFEISIYAKQLERDTHSLIGYKKDEIAKNAVIQAPLILESIIPGSYRLEAIVNLLSENEDALIQELNGSKIVEVFS